MATFCLLDRVFPFPFPFLLLLLHVLLLLSLFLDPSSALLVLKDTHVELPNADFWFMPNDYNVTSSVLIRARFEEGKDCKVTNLVEAKDRILFFAQTDFKEAGCYFYDETIDAVKAMEPLVAIYETAIHSEDIGYLTAELYGNLASYSASGLALTLVSASSAEKIIQALEAGGPVNVSVSYDVGVWVRFASSDHLKAYTALFDIFYGLILIYCVYRLVVFIKEKKTAIPFFMFITCTLFCIFRILDLSVNPLYLRNNTPPWVRIMLFWLGYVFGWAVFVMIGVSWMLLGRHLSVSPWMRRVTRHFIRFSYYSIGHLAVAAVIIITQMAYPGNQVWVIIQIVAYIAIVPILAAETLLLVGFGAQIVYTLRRSMAGNTSRSRIAYRKITLLLISSVMGFLAIAVCIVLSTNKSLTLQTKMAVDWIKEFASLWMLGSIAFALSLQDGPRTTRKGTGSGLESTTPKDTSDKTELDMFSSEAQ